MRDRQYLRLPSRSPRRAHTRPIIASSSGQHAAQEHTCLRHGTMLHQQHLTPDRYGDAPISPADARTHTHDGPDESSCYESIEIQITLYQNGTYYDISDFHKNGVHNVYSNGTIFLDAGDVELFGDLPTGTYEVLVKYRIGTDVSSDHFANSVSIS